MLSNELLDLAEQSPPTTEYTPLAQHSNDVMLLGMQVRNRLDHERINIDRELNPIRVKVQVESDRWKMFHGVKLQPNKRYEQVKRVLTSTPVDHPDSDTIYRARVNFCGLSCDTCWMSFDDKIFPLDMSNLTQVSLNTPYMRLIKKLCNHENNNMPWYTQHSQPNIYILCHR